MHLKLPILAALTALSLWGCSHQSANARHNTDASGGSGRSQTSAQQSTAQQSDSKRDNETPLEASDVTKKEHRDREGAPTVYDGEATGGSGSERTVTQPDGQKWKVDDGPGMANEPSGPKNKPRNSDSMDSTGGAGGTAGQSNGDAAGSSNASGGSGSGGSGSGGSGGGGGGGGGGGTL
jgi:hypothetical protein